MVNDGTPSRLQGQASGKAPTTAQTLSSEAVLDALKMILLGTSLGEILTSVVRLIESHCEGMLMLCSIFILEKGKATCTQAKVGIVNKLRVQYSREIVGHAALKLGWQKTMKTENKLLLRKGV